MLVFVYGTLTDPVRVDDVLDDWSFPGDAVLEGLHRVDGDYPTLAPGGRVPGRLLRTAEVDRLDRYERVEQGLYVRVSVPIHEDASAAAVYVGDPDRLGVDVEWPGDGPLVDRVLDYVETTDVVVRRDRQG